jgi:hypothetical protein
MVEVGEEAYSKVWLRVMVKNCSMLQNEVMGEHIYIHHIDPDKAISNKIVLKSL